MFDNVTLNDLLLATFGGVMIGLSATLLLWGIGRIAGICGIAFSLLASKIDGRLWRFLFVLGLIVGAQIAHSLFAINVPDAATSNLWLLIGGGLLVGFGTQVANGCTSGHGICGLARRSYRSLTATLVFMVTGMLTMLIFRHGLGWV